MFNLIQMLTRVQLPLTYVLDSGFRKEFSFIFKRQKKLCEGCFSLRQDCFCKFENTSENILECADWSIRWSDGLDRYHNKREKVYEKMGGRCIKCGFNYWKALQIDHIKGGGSKDPLYKNRNKLFNYILNNKKWYRKYQLLCANCNVIKKYKRV